MVGLDETSSAYRIYLPDQRKIMKSGHVIFNEKDRDIRDEHLIEEYELLTEDIVKQSSTDDHLPCPLEDQNIPQVTSSSESIDESETLTNSEPLEAEQLHNETAEDEVEGLIETRNGRPQRKRKMHNYLELARGTEESAFMICMSEALNVDSPKNFSEAMNSIFADRWSEAIREGLISINQHETWTETELPEGTQACSTKWIFTVKRDERGNPIRWKARLVVRRRGLC
jgi:hypothetical protein